MKSAFAQDAVEVSSDGPSVGRLYNTYDLKSYYRRSLGVNHDHIHPDHQLSPLAIKSVARTRRQVPRYPRSYYPGQTNIFPNDLYPLNPYGNNPFDRPYHQSAIPIPTYPSVFVILPPNEFVTSTEFPAPENAEEPCFTEEQSFDETSTDATPTDATEAPSTAAATTTAGATTTAVTTAAATTPAAITPAATTPAATTTAATTPAATSTNAKPSVSTSTEARPSHATTTAFTNEIFGF